MSMSEDMITLLQKEYEGMSAEELTAFVELQKVNVANTVSALRRLNIDPSMVDAASVKPGVERMLLTDYYNILVKMAAARRALHNSQAVVR